MIQTCKYCNKDFENRKVRIYCSCKCSMDDYRKTNKEKFILSFEEKYKHLQYVSGYIDDNHKITYMCKECKVLEKCTPQSIRKSYKLECTNCKHIIKNKELACKAKQRESIKKAKEAIEKENKRVKCLECGNVFYLGMQKRLYCSRECARRYGNRTKDISRRIKLKENGKIEWDISLKKLYDRDAGVCHICNKKVNMDIDSNSDKYGSIDHLNPVANGGTHTWDNIKLAHRSCNSYKRDKIIWDYVSDTC